LGGGLGLPALDALMFHGGAMQTPAPHYDPAGGCGDHGERCTMATAFAGIRLPALHATPSLVSIAPILRFLAATPDRLAHRQPTHLPLSRAPPLLQPLG
jgi:hypothetical protein